MLQFQTPRWPTLCDRNWRERRDEVEAHWGRHGPAREVCMHWHRKGGRGITDRARHLARRRLTCRCHGSVLDQILDPGDSGTRRRSSSSPSLSGHVAGHAARHIRGPATGSAAADEELPIPPSVSLHASDGLSCSHLCRTAGVTRGRRGPGGSRLRHALSDLVSRIANGTAATGASATDAAVTWTPAYVLVCSRCCRSAAAAAAAVLDPTDRGGRCQATLAKGGRFVQSWWLPAAGDAAKTGKRPFDQGIIRLRAVLPASLLRVVVVLVVVVVVDRGAADIHGWWCLDLNGGLEARQRRWDRCTTCAPWALGTFGASCPFLLAPSFPFIPQHPQSGRPHKPGHRFVPSSAMRGAGAARPLLVHNM